MVSLGHKLGLYKAMAGAGPRQREGARRARRLRRTLRARVAERAGRGGYVDYHAVSDTYELSPEQALVLADEDSPVFMPPAWNVPASMWFDEDKTLEAFRTGNGVAWGEHDERLSCGVAAFYRNGYRAQPGAAVAAGAGRCGRASCKPASTVADIGCGHGHSTRADGPGVPELALPRLRRARGVGRRGAAQCRRRPASPTRASFEVADADDLSPTGSTA